MDSGNPSSNRRRDLLFSSDSEEFPFFALGPNGEVQISNSDGGAPQPLAGPFVITGDQSQPSPTFDTGPPPLAMSIPITTQVSPSMPTDSPVFLSQDLLSQSEGGGSAKNSNSPSSTTTVYASPSTQPVSSTVTVTFYPSSGTQRVTFSADATVSSSRLTTSSAATLMSSSRTVLVSATSTSSYTSSTISSSRSSSSMTTISLYSSSSIQTIVISSSTLVSSSTVFTSSSSFSSSSGSRNSSALGLATSTSTDQTPTETVTAPPLPGTGSNLNVHSPPYYVGIVFGTIAGLALLAALIAWWMRLRSHARRRRSERTLVPWARSGDDDDGELEAGHCGLYGGTRQDATTSSMWTPRGDRDVGEPKRSESYLNGSTWSLHNHDIPGHNLFSAESFGALSSIDGYTPAGVRHANRPQRHPPAHLADEDGDDDGYSQTRARPLFVVNAVPSSLTPAYVSPETKARDLPDLDRASTNNGGSKWDQKPPTGVRRTTMIERLRNLGKPAPAEAPWEELDPLPTPGGATAAGARPGNEAWATSIRSSLVSAFNAVAANLTTPGNVHMSKDDKLTIPPTRATRKSINDSDIWNMKGEKSSDLHRHDSLSTVASKAWTLEETGNGTGIVHLRTNDPKTLPPFPQRPAMPPTNLSFGDGDSISMYSERESVFQRIPTRESQIPLIASSKPLPAHVRPDGEFTTRRISSDSIPAAYRVSRNSSAARSVASRSTRTTRSLRGNLKEFYFSDHSSEPRVPPGIDPPSSTGSGAPSVRSGLRRGYSDKDSVVIQPDTISRLSSTDTSVLASTIDGHARSETADEVAASRALKDRHRRASQGLMSGPTASTLR